MRQERLRILRVKHHLTQQDVADRIGITTGSYTLIEQGKRHGSVSTWKKIQEIFSLDSGEAWDLMNSI